MRCGVGLSERLGEEIVGEGAGAEGPRAGPWQFVSQVRPNADGVSRGAPQTGVRSVSACVCPALLLVSS